MESDERKSYEKAGAIFKEVKSFALKRVKPGIGFLELADSIENKIIELGGKSAFPVNLGINDIAAHFTPSSNDSFILEESMLLKIDFGVHINGFVADGAFSVNFNNNYAKLIEASESALNNVISSLKVGVEIGALGKIIEDTIKDKGFNPIFNLSGHGVSQYVCHCEPTIPNYNNNNPNLIEEDMTIAIEPFATSGKGFIKESGSAEIFETLEPKQVRNIYARKILNFILEEYKDLPFALRWVERDLKLSEFQLKVGMRELIHNRCLKSFPVLKEITSAPVSQNEKTFIFDGSELIIIN